MAHEGLWQQLAELDGYKTAVRAQCQYLTEPERYFVKLLNTEYVVDLADKQIFSVGCAPHTKKEMVGTAHPTTSEPAGFLQQLCVLAYLINAQDLPLANKLVQAEVLPGGQFFFRGIHSLPAEKLEKAFGEHPEALHQIAKQLGAKVREFGDASIEFTVLPRIPLTVVVWKGDEQFSARASILFDQTAAAQLPLDALLAAVNLTVEALVNASAASG